MTVRGCGALAIALLGMALAGCGAEAVGTAATGAVMQQEQLKAGQAAQQQVQQQLQQGLDLGQQRNAASEADER